MAKKKEEEKLPEEVTSRQCVATVDDNNGITITFNHEFEIDEKYNVMAMHRRRSGKGKLYSAICDALNAVFSSTPDATEFYASLRVLILDKPDLTIEEFCSYCRAIAAAVVPVATAYVDEHYVPDKIEAPDEGYKSRGRRSNKELQFTNEHSKMLLRISFGIKVLLPLILEYNAAHPGLSYEDIYLKAIEPCFDCDPQSGEIDILNKVFKIIDSRVKGTKYSDKVIWRFISNYSMNSVSMEDDFFRKLLIEIVPKLEYRGCISFLHVTVKVLLQYQFRYKFPLSYHAVNLIDGKSDNTDLSNLERIEFNLARVDESVGVITEGKIYDLLLSAMNDKQYPISTVTL